MSERTKEKSEQDWSDSIPEEDSEQPEPFERTYRDGSVQHECWDSDR